MDHSTGDRRCYYMHACYNNPSATRASCSASDIHEGATPTPLPFHSHLPCRFPWQPFSLYTLLANQTLHSPLCWFCLPERYIQYTHSSLEQQRPTAGLATQPPSCASTRDLCKHANTTKKIPGRKTRTAGRASGDLKRAMTSMSSRVDTTAGASLMKGSHCASCSHVAGLSTFTPAPHMEPQTLVSR